MYHDDMGVHNTILKTYSGTVAVFYFLITELHYYTHAYSNISQGDRQQWLMWSSVVVSVQQEKGDGSRSGMVTISCWPRLRESYSPPPCQAGSGAPWPGSAALLPGEREQRGAAEVLRWSASPTGLPLRSNQGRQSPCPPASSPTRPDCSFSPTDRKSLRWSFIKNNWQSRNPITYSASRDTTDTPHSIH